MLCPLLFILPHDAGRQPHRRRSNAETCRNSDCQQCEGATEQLLHNGDVFEDAEAVSEAAAVAAGEAPEMCHDGFPNRGQQSSAFMCTSGRAPRADNNGSTCDHSLKRPGAKRSLPRCHCLGVVDSCWKDLVRLARRREPAVGAAAAAKRRWDPQLAGATGYGGRVVY